LHQLKQIKFIFLVLIKILLILYQIKRNQVSIFFNYLILFDNLVEIHAANI
jgi:hypothetical protein